MTRPFAPMTREDVQRVQEAGRRAKALEVVIDLSLKRGLNESARIAQRELTQLRAEIYKTYDIRL